VASDSPGSTGSEPSRPAPTTEPAEGDAVAGRDATPSVLAVVVAHHPDEAFADTLESLASQDYGRLSVAVVDAGADPELESRVHTVLPDATVLAGRSGRGFPAAANSILGEDPEAAFLMICHDDVVLAPDAVRSMVVECLRSNAGIVGPKLVDWDEPDRLQHVGLLVDRFGVTAEIIEPGERDQEQHDSIGDVFAVPSACMLVRTDLFGLLGGFDEAITFRGEDVDLCWRAQLVGARVIVVPDAVVRHRERLFGRRGVDDVRRTRARHSLRTILVNHGRISLLLVLPLAVLMTLAEAGVALAAGRVSHMLEVLGAWPWNLRRLPDVIGRRRRNRRIRRVRPADVIVGQHLGSVRVSAFVRGQIGRDRDSGGIFAGAGRGLVASWQTGTTRASIMTWCAVLVFFWYGSRNLLTDGVAAVGDFAVFPDGSGDLFGAWWNGWHDRDLGSPGSSLAGIGLMGAVAWLLGGATGLARTIWVLGPFIVGLIGIWRVLGVTGSRRAQMGALVCYVVLPLAYASIGGASIAGLVGYAAAPWILSGLLKVSGVPPFRSSEGPAWSFWSAAVGLGAITGLVAAFEPAAVGLVPVIAGGLVLGGLLAARPGGTFRILAGTVVALGVGAVLALPLVLDLLTSGPTWDPVADGRGGQAGPHSLAQLLRFATGPDDPGFLVWVLVVVVVVPLLLGRSWRFELAVRCWTVAASGWAIAFAAERGALPFGLPDVELLLAPAAAALAVCAGLAVTSVEHDLRFARFGWRQAMLPLALVAAVLAAIPAVGSLTDGRWDLPRGDYRTVIPLASTDDGSYRVLWIASPDFLPVQGRPLAGGLAWSATLDREPTVVDRAVAIDDGAAVLVEDVIRAVLEGQTARVGRRLAGLGIRYVVLLDRLAPAPFSSPDDAVPVQGAVIDAFSDQLDLQRIEGTNSAVHLFSNTSWTPVRAALAPGFDDGISRLSDLERTPLGAGSGVLVGGGTSLSGPIPEGAEIFVAQTPDSGWKLTLNGQAVSRRTAVGWASAYQPGSGGQASLDYSTVWWRNTTQLVQVAAFLLLCVLWLRRRIGGSR
jgi:GT2 family glycosyltransferase